MNYVLLHLIACDLWYLVFEKCYLCFDFLILEMSIHSLLTRECFN